MKLGAVARALSLCVVFLSGALPAHAIPFSVSMPITAARGTGITSSLFDGGVSGLEAADIWLTFDSRVFSDLVAAPGLATRGFSVLAGLPEPAGGSLRRVPISLATTGAPVDGVSGTLLDVSFLVRSDAPIGPAELTFEADPLSDYSIPTTSGTLVVLAPVGTVPEPASSLVFAIGMFALAGFRGRGAAKLR